MLSFPWISFNWFVKKIICCTSSPLSRRLVLTRYSQIFSNTLRCTEALLLVLKPSANMSHRSNILLLAQHAWNALLFSSQVDWSLLLSLGAGEWRGIRDVRSVLGRRLQFGTSKSGRWCVGKKNWVESDHKAVGGLVLCKYYRCWDTGCHNLLLLTVMKILFGLFYATLKCMKDLRLHGAFSLFMVVFCTTPHNIFFSSILIVSHLFSPHTI